MLLGEVLLTNSVVVVGSLQQSPWAEDPLAAT